jgi:ferredoxin
MIKLRVWIDQDLCTGDGICADIEPAIFEMHTDGLAYVKNFDWPSIYNDNNQVVNSPILQMGNGTADIPESVMESVIDAADACPGECIFIEPV